MSYSLAGKKEINTLHICFSDKSGGAARAAFRIHNSLSKFEKDKSLISRMRVLNKLSNDEKVISGNPKNQNLLWRKIHPRLNKLVKKNFFTQNNNLHTIAWPDTGLGYEIKKLKEKKIADIIHLHWLGDSLISIEEIGRIKQPIIWTLHDQWPFCGAEHYTIYRHKNKLINTDKRFELGYKDSSRPLYETGKDLNKLTWLRKKACWKKQFEIVCPSTWMADCVRRSELMHDWPISTIPYPINLEIWKPFDKLKAREILNLPINKTLILYGAVGGTDDPRKGSYLLFEALEYLKQKASESSLENLELVVFGQEKSSNKKKTVFPTHFLGHFYDDLSLRLLYASADLFVLPSIQDNLPQTGLESQASGTPVVAFRTGGMIDIVDDKVTGALADPFDPSELASSIQWVLEDRDRLRKLGTNSRMRAERIWNPSIIADKYMNIYQKIFKE